MERNDVFVGNLPYNCSEEMLYEHFSQVGEVMNVKIMSDKDTQRQKGYAFISYKDSATAVYIPYIKQLQDNNSFFLFSYALLETYTNQIWLAANSTSTQQTGPYPSLALSPPNTSIITAPSQVKLCFPPGHKALHRLYPLVRALT